MLVEVVASVVGGVVVVVVTSVVGGVVVVVVVASVVRRVVVVVFFSVVGDVVDVLDDATDGSVAAAAERPADGPPPSLQAVAVTRATPTTSATTRSLTPPKVRHDPRAITSWSRCDNPAATAELGDHRGACRIGAIDGDVVDAVAAESGPLDGRGDQLFTETRSGRRT